MPLITIISNQIYRRIKGCWSTLVCTMFGASLFSYMHPCGLAIQNTGFQEDSNLESEINCVCLAIAESPVYGQVLTSCEGPPGFRSEISLYFDAINRYKIP